MSEIKSLGDIEHVQLRPGMYIGSTFSPDGLAREIEDNAYDELANKFATRITIDNPSPGNIIVTDNGRGIPIHDVLLESGEVKDSIVVACTKLFSGAKFDESTYSYSIGLHGVGLVAVNALSNKLSVTVKDRDPKKQNLFHHYEFIDSKLVRQESAVFNNIPWSTRIEFTINPKYFTIQDFNINKMYERACLVTSKFVNCEIIINGQIVPKGTLEQFARYKLGLNDDVQMYKIRIKQPASIEEALVYFTYDLNGQNQPEIHGDVNLHICNGTYLTNFVSLITKCITKKYELSKNEGQSKLRAYVSLITQHMEFDSQSKATMTRNMNSLFMIAENEMTKLISLSSYLQEIFNEIINRKSFSKAANKVSKKMKRISAQDGFKDCISTPGGILYVMEGKSADGSLSQIRDRKTEAILPISGKILNVTKSNVEKSVNSKKFKFLLEVLGVNLKTVNQTDYRYKKVKMLCDADPDGLHIVVLVTMGIWYYAPNLIKNRQVSVILPPLYGAVKGSQFVPLYSMNETANYPNHQILRFKGIGEMSPDQLEVVIRDSPKEYVLSPPASKEEQDNIIRCITDTELKRRLCEDNRFTLNMLFKAIAQQ